MTRWWKFWIGATLLLAAAAAGGVAGIALTMPDTRPLQAQVTQLRHTVTAEQGQLAAAEAKLNAASTTGDLLTCTDLRNLEDRLPVTVNGTDTYGNYLTLYGTVQATWLPDHCYKP